MAKHKNKKSVLLKNGLLVDGTGKKGYRGNLLIIDDKIETLSQREIKTKAAVIDCTDKVIAPGFIDLHSHNDWFLPNMKRPDL